MATTGPGGEPRRSGRPQVRAADQDDRTARQAWRSEHVLTPAGFKRLIAVMETTARVESGLAETLHAMAAQDTGEAGARRLRLAEDAAQGAQAAVKHSERWQQHARWWAEHTDVAALDQALEQAGKALADLARAENGIADILTRLASRNGSDLAARRRRLAAQASAAARRARDRAQALRELATTDAATAHLPEQIPVADMESGLARLESAGHQRLAKADRRVAGPHRAAPERPGDDPAPQAGRDVPGFAQEASRYWQKPAARLRQMRQRALDALSRAAGAHDRAAEAHEGSVRAGIGDMAEHKRRAAFHRAAARASRQRAQEINDQAVAPAQESPKATAVLAEAPAEHPG